MAGLTTWPHRLPFQCTIRALPGCRAGFRTAHAFAADVAATPNSSPSAGLIGIRRAVVPARRTMRFLGSPPCTSTPAWPTAHPPPGNVATAFNPPRDGSAGLLTVLQAVPFQWARIGLSLSALSLEV